MDMELQHYGVKGQKWGVRRYQDQTGRNTDLGLKRRRVVETDDVKRKTSKLASLSGKKLSSVSEDDLTHFSEDISETYRQHYLSSGSPEKLSSRNPNHIKQVAENLNNSRKLAIDNEKKEIAELNDLGYHLKTTDHLENIKKYSDTYMKDLDKYAKRVIEEIEIIDEQEPVEHSDEFKMDLYHHGIKGQKWGVRRYQYADGTLTPAGKKRYNDSSSITQQKVSRIMNTKVKELVNTARTQITGKQYVDTYLKEGTTFSRIQTSKEFEKFAFYATYKKSDSDKYMGLFGKNLTSRAERDAVKAEKISNATGSETDIAKANELREKRNSMKVYQLKLKSTDKLKVPSDENAADITAKLLKEDEFKQNVMESIRDSKEKMRRPQQQILFRQAENALRKDTNKLTVSEKISVYKALNLSLVNHNAQEIAAQNRFYSELKKKGYNALLDYNDKEYSSYHAKRPMIVFDVDSVKLQSVTETNPKVVDKLYRKYNTERVAKETVANTLGLVSKIGTKTVSECDSYVRYKTEKYLS